MIVIPVTHFTKITGDSDGEAGRSEEPACCSHAHANLTKEGGRREAGGGGMHGGRGALNQDTEKELSKARQP